MIAVLPTFEPPRTTSLYFSEKVSLDLHGDEEEFRCWPLVCCINWFNWALSEPDSLDERRERKLIRDILRRGGALIPVEDDEVEVIILGARLRRLMGLRGAGEGDLERAFSPLNRLVESKLSWAADVDAEGIRCCWVGLDEADDVSDARRENNFILSLWTVFTERPVR